MLTCSCGRRFGSDNALTQHQRDKARRDTASACQTPPADPSAQTIRSSGRHASYTGWIWRDVRSRKAIQTISHATVEPSDTPVFSALSCDLLCSYNWQTCKDATVVIPGFAPVWQDNPLPITLPKDKGSYFVDQNASRMPQFPFEPLFRATAAMKPGFRFDDVDIVVNRNSLRKLLDFCSGRVKQTFRINLAIVHNSLFLERCERSARELIRGSQNSGWGHAFEQAFTKFPLSVDESTGHHRVLHYALGNLRCVVRFEVDACYNQTNGKIADEQAGEQFLASAIGKLSLAGPSEGRMAEGQQFNCPSLMPHSTAAEMKTATKPKSIGHFMPQLWFGRTPWLIVGCHKNGTFNEVRITHAAAQFQGWEDKHQAELRKLVTVLAKLRAAVRKNGNRRCIAICERGQGPPVISVFPSKVTARPLPDEVIRMFWKSNDMNE
ncbi:hypothetical protein CDD83_9397 [Cordyceps sp. RAO-2017]|nr:hypothetical protein CDD83_9397 [Cordyceps sp. RAO-2017]